MRNSSGVLQRIATAPFRLILGIGELFSRWFFNLIRDIRDFFREEPEDSSVTEALAKTIEHPQGLLVHLNALRKHLLRAVAFLAITTALSFLFTHRILEFLARPLPGGVDSIVAIEVTEPLGVLMRVALLSGFALALPYIALEMWLFIAPGVSRKARIWGLFAIPVSVLFFLGGMAFAYFVMMPTAIPFLLNILGISTQIRPSSYIGFVTGLMFWVGIIFQFPLVIFVLAGVGLIKARALANQWRLAIVIIAVVAAAITPTVDPVSMSLVMAPMIGLFFLSIGLAFLAQRGRK